MSSEIEQDTRNGMALMIAFMCGMVTGAALGLLLAPARGRDTREWIVVQGRSARQRTSRFLNQNQAITIVRREGVRGLLHRLRRVEEPA